MSQQEESHPTKNYVLSSSRANSSTSDYVKTKCERISADAKTIMAFE
jgi:hypothetical protein